jgi:flagellar hook-associated protein 2
MATSTNLISGLSSGFDWRSMIDQLMAIEHRRVDLVTAKKTDAQTKLTEWQSFNTKLLAMKTAAGNFKDAEDFAVYKADMTSNSSTIKASDLLAVTTSTTASVGSYSLKITNLAEAQKLSSSSFTGTSDALGAGYAGDMLINGTVISIAATDTLTAVKDMINYANTGANPTGVTASIISYGTGDNRLILSSDTTGEDGISLLNGSAMNLVQKFGWKDNQAAVVKNSITNGAQSDLFTSQNVTIKSLLGLATGETSTGTLKIGGTAVTIDLAAKSLTGIKDAINLATGDGIVASIVSEAVDGTTYYRLQIEGTQAFVDENNILNTLGIQDHGSSVVNGKISGNAMTKDGAYITADTLLVDVDGYISYTGGDNILMEGFKTGGGAVNPPYSFSITATKTVADLLSAIESQYATTAGDVAAYITSDGKIRVDDLTGGSSLAVTFTDTITNGQLEFGIFGVGAERQREIVAGADAAMEVDGVAVTSSENTIDDVIAGVTLNLLNKDAAGATTITLKIGHDINAIKSGIQEFVGKYNEVMTYINSQSSYDEESKETGGVLFGDGTLSSVKSDLTSLLTQNIWGVNSGFSILGLVGITMDKNLILGVDSTKLGGYLQTNFNDIVSLFAGKGTTSSSTLSYNGHSNDSKAGDYTVHINRAATQGTETGNAALSAGGAVETLTITQGNSTAAISITVGMTLEDIKNAINSEVETEYTEILVGANQLKKGGIAITSQTAWVDIDDTTLVDGDIISFIGTNRTGGSVSGSYTITSNETQQDTVKDLLSAIEAAYSSNVTATIDTSGRISLIDKYSGYSQLSLAITGLAGRGLDFGAIDVTAGAGDGSQEGRYAMQVTADDDGSGHLVIGNDDYGSTSFTISQDSADNNYDQIINSTTSNTTVATNGDVYVTETTTWADVYGATVVNNDTITIAGAARDGTTPISGTYTILNKTTNTINGLLTAIENAYAAQGTTVNAFLKDGKIYVEDTTPGASSISLTLTANNEGSGSSLDLGTVDQTTKRDLDLGLINGTVTGQAVAGTINGEAATGSGLILTGNDGNTNTDGLSVRYSGSANNTDVGSIKLTLGVAELFDRTLYGITDIYDGYSTFKTGSLQDSISAFNTQIEDMEAQLSLKQELLLNRFVQMELALQKIQSQSNWLTGQINAADSAWRT